MQAGEKGLEVRNLIGGKWEERDGHDTEPVYDPATGEIVAQTPLSTRDDVDRAVRKAGEAFSSWAATPVVERARILFSFKDLLEEHFEELRDLVTLENGKDAADAAGEVRRGIEVVEFACGMPTLMMGETVRDVAKGIDNSSWRYHLGVVAAITPFNFPCMVPLWTLPVAIGAGNAYILKPSERTPLCSVKLGELLSEAGLPDGVFSIVNGAREVVDGILEHPGIEAVSFVGSHPVAEHVYTHGCAHGKRVQALAGAKNSMLVMPDAVLEKAVPNIISSAYGNAGERCLAGSVLVAVGGVADDLVERLKEAAASMKIGPGAEEGSELTPVIRDSHRDKVRSYVDPPGSCDGRDAGWPRGDLRSCPLSGSCGHARRGHRVHKRLALRQRLLYLHRRRGGREILEREGGGRDARGQRRGRRPDGVLPVQRGEELLLRGSARHWQGRGALLYREQGGDNSLALRPYR